MKTVKRIEQGAKSTGKERQRTKERKKKIKESVPEKYLVRG